ncbi:unnamed protein product [Paramecium pentaurelia]|uniref:Uncharacterized protein n=1 Tax=Paramecium pentaurelia TaxID=43138 RepID=A0A8S1U7R4_9CILI|nr:unnamed protein product [Paramecium pentaurelia]
MQKLQQVEDNQLLTNKQTAKPNQAIESLVTQKMVPYKELYRYATQSDKLLISIGILASIGNGVIMPMFSVIFGDMTDAFSGEDPDKMISAAGQCAIWFLVLAGCAWLLSFLSFTTFMISGERQSIRMRKEYFSAILRQEVGWFDSINPNELNTKVADETFAVEDAIKEKAGTFIITFSTFICGFIIGYSYGWQLALVITAAMPCLAISVVIMTVVVMKSIKATQECYSTAAAESEQTLNAIKTVKMLDGEDFECEKYSRQLIVAANTNVKYSLLSGMALGSIFAFMIWTYALGFYYGAKLISDQVMNSNTGMIYTVGDVMTGFFAILMGSFSIGQAGPCYQAFAKGKVAGAQIFFIIDRIPKILNPINPKPLKNFNGEITIQDVDFFYPSRPDTQILDKCSLKIPQGKKVALVGESGCGKSTILQLIERFYDVNEGKVLVGQDQIDVRDLDLKEYRTQIGLVGQEPMLFATSIRDNLLYGKTDATEEELIQALKKVNAWDFINKMDKGLDTYVGMGGSQLSGGQKQRIAIARAILKKPKVLLLDEATSALDRTNEKLIQETLDEVSQVIAHRLSTIQNADIIYVFAGGKVVEVGTHQELMNLHGKYEQLAKNQITSHKKQQQKLENNFQANQNNQQQQQDLFDQQDIDVSSVLSVNQFDKEQPNVFDQAIKEIKDIKHLNNQFKNKDQNNFQEMKTQSSQNDSNDAQIMSRLFSYGKEERCFLILGLLSAVLNGCIFPCFSLFFSDMITLLVESDPNLYSNNQIRDQQMDKVKSDSSDIALWFFLFGLGFLVFQSLENFFLSIVAENLTMKLRNFTFRKLLKMPISFFDKPENNAGTLTSRLSVDCKTVQSLTSTIIGFKCQNASALICGMAIAFSSSWALTLIVLATAPFRFIGMKLRAKYMGTLSVSSKVDTFKDAGNLIMEAVTNIRTVFSFGNENIILDDYTKKIQGPLKECVSKGLQAGSAFGFSQMQPMLINAIVFYCGALLVKYQGLDVNDMFRAIFGITFATMGGARDSHFVGDVDKGRVAAGNIFEILDSIDEFQIEEQKQFKRLKTQIKGNIECINLTFKYPTREKNVFTNLSLTIPSGQKVAFVGSSGCGKSTIMQMLMRFYDPDQGQILVDGLDIRDYDIRHLRKQLAIVSQEPVLFNGTIKENIQYNINDVSMQQIEEVAKKANAYDFIINDQFENASDEKQQDFGKGFHKRVGPKGSQISGGQKQRIAIARAVLRNANILLLDEATSALDAKSEEIVQESLNNIMKNNTTLSIAHRISTIKDSDIIYVFDNGMIVEQGNYNYLVGLKQFFYRMEKGIAIASTKNS